MSLKTTAKEGVQTQNTHRGKAHINVCTGIRMAGRQAPGLALHRKNVLQASNHLHMDSGTCKHQDRQASRREGGQQQPGMGPG